jgi:membrane protein implicated in regulation of membrane protease activity
MDSWVVWTIAACVLGVGEMLTMGFFLAPFAAGALLAALLSAAGASGAVAVIGFLGVAVASLAMRHRSMPPQIRTGAAALIGRRALVLERIANREGVGSVKIGGEVWTARAFDDDRVIEAGEQVEVVEIRGATALVME